MSTVESSNPKPVSLDDVTVVVVTFNSAHCLPALSPLLQQCPHVVISDNASNDGCAQQARSLWPHATVLEHQQNLGFGAANNRALQQVNTPFALLLNPDCELTALQLKSLLATAHQHPDAAVVAPQLVQPSLQAEVNYRWPHHLWTSAGPGAHALCCVGFVCGAAMLLRMQRMQEVVILGNQYFDERFFLYYEDDDLCLRLFQAHLPMLIDPAVQAVHRSRGSVKGKSPYKSEYLRGYHHAQSKLIFAAKHQSLGVARALQRQLMVQTCLALPLRVLLFSPKLIARMWGRLLGVMKWKT
jgi:GT2 family glycosyltransferase